MLKRNANLNMKLISRSLYAVALAIPFISPFGETKASKIFTAENQLFFENEQTETFQFSHQLEDNELNLDFDEFLIAEEKSKEDENKYTTRR